MKRPLPLLLTLALGIPSAYAHHGVASLGLAALEGPGAPVETSSSATLPQGKWLGYLKADHAKYHTYDPTDHTEADYAQYWLLGLGYGFTPWFSAYLFQPYNIKQDEPDGFKSRGFADPSLVGVLGFKYDEGLRLTPANESLDDLMDWHFTAYAGLSLPTGEANHRLGDGSIDPGMSLGFGKPSLSYGFTATKPLTDTTTLVFEAGQMRFRAYTYADGQRMRFGTETRANAALAQRLLTLPERRFRVDGNLELNFLRLGRDVENGLEAPATGGDILYGVFGARLYKEGSSLALAVKRPIRTRLNEADQQQGAEGKEKYRLIASFSMLF
jgi:hypothetical protein